MLSAVQSLIMLLDKKLLLILHVITKVTFNIFIYKNYVVVKMVCFWKSHNLDKRALGTYMRVTVNKSIDKCTFTLRSQAMNFD